MTPLRSFLLLLLERHDAQLLLKPISRIVSKFSIFSWVLTTRFWLDLQGKIGRYLKFYWQIFDDVCHQQDGRRTFEPEARSSFKRSSIWTSRITHPRRQMVTVVLELCTDSDTGWHQVRNAPERGCIFESLISVAPSSESRSSL